VTDFETRCQVLQDLMTLQLQDDPTVLEFADLVGDHNMGLLIAVLTERSLVVPTEAGTSLVNAAFDRFLEMLGLEDVGWETFDELVINRAQ
jgi:hypothetical protein